MAQDDDAHEAKPVGDDWARETTGDPILALFVHLVERVDSVDVSVGIEVLLTVGGVVIAGELVSARRYFQWLGDDFPAAFPASVLPQSTRDDITRGLRTIGWKVTEGGAHYLHLRDAQIVAPGQPSIRRGAGFWWRGRLASVDGFALQVPRTGR